VSIRALGFVQCCATFSYVAELPRNATVPLLCVGFAAPPDADRLRGEFGAFPFLDLRAAARQRLRIESRNRDDLLQTAKARQDLTQRYAKADQALQLLAEEAEQLLGARTQPHPAKLAAVEKTMERIDAAINDLAAYADRLASAAAATADGRHMTRKEEVALLDALKNQVRDARRQLEALA
jgi:hypothetical protein